MIYFLIIGRIARIGKQRRFQSKRKCFRIHNAEHMAVVVKA